MKNNIDIIDLVMQLSESEEMLNKQNEEIKNIKEAKEKKSNQTFINKDNYNTLKQENEGLELSHKLCLEDIKEYKDNLLKLEEEQKKNERKILMLKEENTKLKNENNKLNKIDSKDYKKTIINIKDLRKTLGFGILKQSNEEKKKNENDMNNRIYYEENEFKNLNLIKQKKEEFDKILTELKNKSNQFNAIMHQQSETINEYRNYLNEIFQYISSFRERINVSLINSVLINDNNEAKIDKINEQFDNTSIILAELDDIMYKIKNNFGGNVENLLIDIQTNIENLGRNENQNKISFNNICSEINQKIDELEKIFSDYKKNKVLFDSKNHEVEEEMNKLKTLHKNLTDYYKNKRQNDQNNNNNNDTIINNNQNINLNQYINQYNNNNQIINNRRKQRIIGQSFLFNVKDVSSKLDLYKTVNLFKENEQDLLEMYIEEAQLLRKNYHEICYVYDDYDIYDIYYDLKAVGLSNNSYFPKCIHPFYYDKIIEIQSFLIDGVPSQYIMKGHSIEFKVDLYNFEIIKIHIKYKATKDLSRLSDGEIEERSIYRSEYYGIDKSMAGQMAKFSLILKGSFDIVNFDDYFLVRNTNNKNEVEYMWGGRVPYQGKRTCIMFSKKEANWSFHYSSKFHCDNFINETKYYVPIEFIGGNNEIININPTSPQSTNIIIDEENRRYIAEYYNTNCKDGEFIIKGELRNKCKGEWEVDLTDEEVEKKMPEEDVLCKQQLKTIAKKIIDEFDKNNKDNDFEFLDYMKIGLWVYKNIKYDYNYIGKTEFSAVDIYNMRVGVCHHFTKLSNALLYALGYKVIYASGYTCKKNKIFKTDTGHAWSLVKLENNKWYPFDSTWGIFTGKLPVGHIFATFFSRGGRIQGYDTIRFDKHEMEGKFIES